MKTAVMKTIAWLSYAALAGILLNGCSDASNPQHSLSSAKIAALQTAMNQANDAREEIIKADNNQRLARQEANNKQQAVQQAFALASQESEQLRQDAENKSRWANSVHNKALASRKALLQAAMQQTHAKQQLLEAEKAVQAARHQFQMDEHDAQLTAKIQYEAKQALNLVLEAEQLARLSMDQLAIHQPSDSNQPDLKPTHHASQNSAASKATHKKETAAQPKAVAKKQRTKTVSKITKVARNTVSPNNKHNKINKTMPHRSLKLASLSNAQPENLLRGQKLAQKCLLCHNFKPSPKKKFGPNLFAVLNQPAGKSKHYKYSSTLAAATFSWNEENLAQWICHSGKSIKQLTGRDNARTKMSNQRICGQDAKDTVAYLRSLQSRASVASSQARASRSLQLAGAI